MLSFGGCPGAAGPGSSNEGEAPALRGQGPPMRGMPRRAMRVRHRGGSSREGQGCKKNVSRYGTFFWFPRGDETEPSSALFFCSAQDRGTWSAPRHVFFAPPRMAATGALYGTFFLVLGGSGSPGSRIPGRSAAGKQKKRTFFLRIGSRFCFPRGRPFFSEPVSFGREQKKRTFFLQPCPPRIAQFGIHCSRLL